MDELRSQIDEEALHALDFNPASKETVKDYLEILKAQFKVGSERKQVGLVLDGLPGKQARLLKDEAGGDLDWLTLLPAYLHEFKAASMATHKMTWPFGSREAATAHGFISPAAHAVLRDGKDLHKIRAFIEIEYKGCWRTICKMYVND